MNLEHVNSISVSSLFIFCAQFLFLLCDRVVLSSGLSFFLALIVYAFEVLVYLLSYTIVEGNVAPDVVLLGQQ
jgi:hypothetical protein